MVLDLPRTALYYRQRSQTFRIRYRNFEFDIHKLDAFKAASESKLPPCDTFPAPYSSIPIRDQFKDGLKNLLQNCWQQSPNLRPSLQSLSKELNELLLQAFIYDDIGRQFWRKNFPNKVIICKNII